MTVSSRGRTSGGSAVAAIARCEARHALGPGLLDLVDAPEPPARRGGQPLGLGARVGHRLAQQLAADLARALVLELRPLQAVGSRRHRRLRHVGGAPGGGAHADGADRLGPGRAARLEPRLHDHGLGRHLADRRQPLDQRVQPRAAALERRPRVVVGLDRLGTPGSGPGSDRPLGGSRDRHRHQCTPRIRYASAVASPDAFSLGSFLPAAAADSGNTLYAMCRIWSTALGASA